MKVIVKFKYLLLWVLKIVYRSSYRLFSLAVPVDENKILMVVSRSKNLEGNLKFIHDELITQKPDAKIHLISSANKMNLKLFKELFAIAGAKYLILDDFFLPIYLIKPAKSLKVIQLWHAAGAFKKFGYSTVDKAFGPNKNYLRIVPVHSNYTHVYVSSPNVVPHYAEAFNMPVENIYPLGIPRTDMFTDQKHRWETIEKLRRQYNQAVLDKVVVLFAPTYRAANKQKESDVDFIKVLTELAADLDPEKLIVYKPHPYLVNESLEQLKNYDNILVAKDFTVNEWMLIADAFITDYSSAVFEFALLKKPLAHFVPDLAEYEKGRGLYYPIDKVSDGEIIREYSRLVVWINSRTKNESWDTNRMLSFNFSNISSTTKQITKHFLS